MGCREEDEAVDVVEVSLRQFPEFTGLVAVLLHGLSRLTDERRRGGILLKAAAAAAGTGDAVHLDGHVADLPCRAVDAGQEFSAEDDAAADTGAEGDRHEVRDSAAAAGDLLAEGRAVGVVLDVGGFAEPLSDEVAQRGIVEAEVRGELHDALFIDGTRSADADGRDVIEGHPRFAERQQAGLSHRVRDLFRGTGRVRLDAGRSDDLVLFIHYADGDVRAAEVDAKSYHRLCLPGISSNAMYPLLPHRCSPRPRSCRGPPAVLWQSCVPFS